MKRSIIYISLLFALTHLAAGCSGDQRDELFTSVSVELEMPEGMVCRRIQATLTLQERNTGQLFVTSAFDGASVVMDVLKGYYYITLEGVLTYEKDGQTRSRDIIHTDKYDAVLMRNAEVYTLPWQFRVKEEGE